MIRNIDTCRKPYIAPVDFAEYLQVTTRAVYHWIEKGALQAVRVERTVRIPIEEARRFVKYSTK